jgi:hypothetical protein
VSRLALACTRHLLVLENITFRHSGYHVVMNAGPLWASKTPRSLVTVSV